ncbi:hypothetical protein [Actinorugispora endophytica]|uniref:Magnesium transporter NIPA n=1 Tax=Actinorugispora endophytica TaxID=1605990 RepID=A0A4R6V1T5_9ACTN|nr:hypothetical protein [Actinorugispora endophytica]TDQ51995.1 hypothetical protein EV190_109108 [Actinorugispora endophytica]
MTGLITALVSAAVYSIGLAVEQRALHRSADISVRHPLRLARVLLGDVHWLCGCALAALGSVGLVVSLGLAPVSVVQPAFAGGIALMLLLLAVAQRQSVTRGEVLALGLMPPALLLLGLSLGSGDRAAGTTAGVPLLLTVSAVTLVVCVGGMALAGGGGRNVSAAVMGGAAGLAQGVAGLQGKGIGGLLAERGIVDAAVPVLLSPFPYLYALGWAVGIALFQTSMQRARASVTAPVANVLGNVFMVVFGTVVFAERLPAEPLPLTFRVLGLALTLVVVALVRGTASRVEEETTRLRAAAPGP